MGRIFYLPLENELVSFLKKLRQFVAELPIPGALFPRPSEVRKFLERKRNIEYCEKCGQEIKTPFIPDFD